MKYLVPAFVVEDDQDDIGTMTEAFDKEGEIDYHFFNTSDEFFSVIDENVWIVILDYNLPKMNGQQILDKVLQINKECHCILVSGVMSREMEVAAMYSGAKDCIEKRKGWEFRLAAAVKRHIELVQPKIEKRERDRKLSNEVNLKLSKIRNA